MEPKPIKIIKMPKPDRLLTRASSSVSITADANVTRGGPDSQVSTELRNRKSSDDMDLLVGTMSVSKIESIDAEFFKTKPLLYIVESLMGEIHLLEEKYGPKELKAIRKHAKELNKVLGESTYMKKSTGNDRIEEWDYNELKENKENLLSIILRNSKSFKEEEVKEVLNIYKRIWSIIKDKDQES